MPTETLIIDKSAFQALSRDEATHMRFKYLVNTVPVLLAEILGDAAKACKAGRQSDAQQIALKFGGSGFPPNVDFRQACLANLLGYPIRMTGGILASGGTEVPDPAHGRGIIYDVGPQQEALMRWAAGKFTPLDLVSAQRWRATVAGFDLAFFERHLRTRNICILKPRSDTELRDVVYNILAHDKPQEPWLLFLLDELSVVNDDRLVVRRRWNSQSPTTLQAFAPYAYFCLVALLHVLVLWKHRLTKHEPANLVDVQYLYYLPFCKTFCSKDNLHRRVAPLLMRDNQRFVWGDDMKREMSALAKANPIVRGKNTA